MKSESKPVSRKKDIVVQDLKGEVLIYDLKINKAFCLNDTSALVWQACDGTKSVTEISRSIGKQLNQPANEDLVWLALDQLKQENLLENSEEIVPEFNGMSRREVIKKVGLGTMIAIPLVTGLVAPTAAHAASTCNTATACECPNSDVIANGGNGQCVTAVCGPGGQPCRCRNLGAPGSGTGGAGANGFAQGNCATA